MKRFSSPYHMVMIILSIVAGLLSYFIGETIHADEVPQYELKQASYTSGLKQLTGITEQVLDSPITVQVLRDVAQSESRPGGNQPSRA